MRTVGLVLIAVTLTAVGCGFNISTANISAATMARDQEGKDPTTTFKPDEAFYAVLQLSNAPEDTDVRAVWSAVDVEAPGTNTEIAEAAVQTGDAQIYFDLTNDEPWPTGSYRVDLFLRQDEKPAVALEFEVR